MSLYLQMRRCEYGPFFKQQLREEEEKKISQQMYFHGLKQLNLYP